jgi:hypothetical protein
MESNLAMSKVDSDSRNSFSLMVCYVNILNKQSRTVDKEWSSNLGVGRWANNT